MLLSGYSQLATFTGANGSDPYSKPAVDSSGNLYGTTSTGGANNDGTVWELAAGSSTITTLYNFSGAADGSDPMSGPKLVGNTLYGTTFAGGAEGSGTIYDYNIATSTFTELYQFPTVLVNGLPADYEPYSGVTFDASGNIWGTTKIGGTAGHGAIYELASNGSGGFATAAQIVYSFSGEADGKNPYGGLLYYNGNFYGTARQGGNLNATLGVTGSGTIYEYTPGATSVNVLYTFLGDPNSTGKPDGREPDSGLVMDANGDLFGTTQSGGSSGNLGELFELPRVGNGYASAPTILIAFTGNSGADPGQFPWGAPIIDSVGDIFGTTETGGGPSGQGDVWELPVGATAITILHSFTGGTAGQDGAQPQVGLRMDSNGDLFGTTTGGNTVGVSNPGTIFEITSSTQLVYTSQPVSTTAGVLPSFTVDVEDQYGNIDTSDNSTVTLSVHSGPGLLSGNVSVQAVNGVATFSNVSLDTAGTYSLNATDGTDSAATSGSFTISPAAASQVVFNQQPSSVTAGIAISPAMTVDVEDHFGNIVTAGPSNVTLSVHSGPGTLSGTVTVGTSSGVATFSNVLIDTAGSYTLTASDGSLTAANSSSFTVSAAAAAKLAYFTEPSDVATGAIISPAVVVDVEDAFGNIVTGNSSNVSLAIHTGSGSLSGTTTVAASQGVATFSNVIVNSPGTYTLAATDGSLTSAISSSFTVSNGTASQLGIAQQPSDAIAGDPNSPAIVVDVEDPTGAIVAGNTSTVVLSVHSGPGTLSGTVSVAAVNGVATFDNVILDTAGDYTLTATDGSLATATTSSFTISPAASAQLVFTAQPINTVISTPISPPVVVDVEDAFGNLVTTDSSDVTLSVASGPGDISGTTTVATSGGIATFDNVALDQVGLYTLGASDGSLTGAVSDSFHITLTAPVQLAFQQQPSNITAGNTMPDVTVDVEDSTGALDTADDSYVTISIATGPSSATLSGTLTVQAVNGVATFGDLSITTAGTYSVEVVDGDLLGAVSNSFTVSPAAASQLAFAQQPSTVATGFTMTPPVVVDIEDQYGNRVTSDNSTVTLTLASGPGQLTGTLTQTAQSGAASFNNLSLSEVGTYKLQATDSSFPVITSNSFDDIPPIRHLVVVRQTITAEQFGDVFANVKLEITDESGNIITTDTSTCNVTLSSGPAGAALSGDTSETFSDGYVVFTRLSVDRAGTYTLTFNNGEAATTVVIDDPIPVVRIPMKFRWWFSDVSVAPPVPIPDPFRQAANDGSDSSGSSSSAAPATGSGVSSAFGASSPSSTNTLDSNNSDDSNNDQDSWLQ